MKKIYIKILIILLITFTFIITIFSISPYPTALIIRKLFEKTPKTYPANYADIVLKTKAIKNLKYQSEYSNSYFDIYLPKQYKLDEKIPVIIWVHGGAFVGGDKKDIETYGTILASKGYAVFTVNYALAPETKYPVPLYQLNDFYKHLKNISGEYNLDMSNLFFAGDSAGAQIVAQFLVIQTNENYISNIPPLVPSQNIKGALLYCGPYEINKLGEIKKIPMSFIFNKIGWAYFGKYSWHDSPEANETSIPKNINEKFPPVYITDGNTASFESQGKELVKKLESLGVSVVFRFFDNEEIKTYHEYQFDFSNKEASLTLDDTIDFLDKNYTRESQEK